MTTTSREDRLTGPDRYGALYWCIKVTKAVSKSGEIYLNADAVDVGKAGELICTGGGRNSYEVPVVNPIPVLVIAPGMWTAFFAASVMDGHAIAVHHWEGEVSR